MIAALFSLVAFERLAVGFVRADGTKFSMAPKTMKSRPGAGRETAATENFMADLFRA
jgi:hypothetical protein